MARIVSILFVGGSLTYAIRDRLRARFTGGFRLNSFFDTAADGPIVPPKRLSAAERERLGGLSAIRAAR